MWVTSRVNKDIEYDNSRESYEKTALYDPNHKYDYWNFLAFHQGNYTPTEEEMKIIGKPKP